jgi:hypothetical protein
VWIDELPLSWAAESGGLEKDDGGGRESMTAVRRRARKASTHQRKPFERRGWRDTK